MALTASPAALAESGSAPGVVLGEVVVTARSPGPAWWRVGKGQSLVWVLGLPDGLPKGFGWDARSLDQHLAGARRAIGPAVATASLLAIPAALSLERRMRTKAPIEADLPLQLRARFLAAAAALHHPPSRYDRWNGLVAGLVMIRDFEHEAGVDPEAPFPMIARAAEARGLKPRPAATYKALDMLRTGAAELDGEVEQACLGDALDEIEAGRARALRDAEAWARGDIRQAQGAQVGAERCFDRLPETARVSRQSAADETAAILAALQQPGPSVAFLSLRRLLAKDGVFDQLEAKGVDVEGLGRGPKAPTLR
jgi:hypothetical protein